LLTPPDVISQIMLAIPMWLLFELGIILSKFFKVRIKEASEARKEMDSASTAAATASTGTSALSADKLWEDDDYTYEEDLDDDVDYDDGSKRTIHNEYTDDDTFDTSTPSDKNNDIDSEVDSVNKQIEEESLDSDLYDEDYLPEEDDENTVADDAEKFFDNEDFDELTDEEMESELDRIEADEIADDIVEEKARKRAEAKKDKDNKDES